MPTMTRSARNAARPAHGTARLGLTINGTSYGLRRVPSDASIAAGAWAIRKADGTTYHVAITPHGPTCDCPDWTFHRDGIDPDGCKHIKAMVAVGLVAATKQGRF